MKKDREARLKLLLIEAVLRAHWELCWSEMGPSAAVSVRSVPSRLLGVLALVTLACAEKVA